MGRAARWLLAVSAIALLAFISEWAIRAGEANSITVAALQKNESWRVARAWPELADWTQVQGTLLQAEQLSPDDPAVADALGMMALQRSGAAEYSEKSLGYFARALALRPAWPASWAGVLRARYQRGLTQPPFERIFLEANRLGPTNPEVQREVVRLGMLLWDKLGPPARDAAASAIGAAMRRDPQETLSVAQRRGRLALVCPHVAGDPRLAKTKWPAACGA